MTKNKKNKKYFDRLILSVKQFTRLFRLILPSKKLLFKPSKQTFLHDKQNKNLPIDQKYYHRPNTKPSADKQTQLKENSKERIQHH